MRPGLLVLEPRQNAVLEFFRGGTDCAAMVGGRHFPQDCVWGVGMDSFRMANWDVAIDLAVDQEDWDGRCGCGIFGRDVLHVEVILQARAEEGDFD